MNGTRTDELIGQLEAAHKALPLLARWIEVVDHKMQLVDVSVQFVDRIDPVISLGQAQTKNQALQSHWRSLVIFEDLGLA